eukprot:scaffold23956_cov67-Isochrysis_galbana.AAC.1
MRKETNAVKDSNVQFGDLYLFDSHLCFDWKVFGFHKQQVRLLFPPPPLTTAQTSTRARSTQTTRTAQAPLPSGNDPPRLELMGGHHQPQP